MSQFILNDSAPRTHAFYALDKFARSYVEAMFFTNGDTSDDNENRLNDMGVERLTRASVTAIKRDCDAFKQTIMPDGCFLLQWLARIEDDYSIEQAGCDFWFTRQGHGVGFWDRKELDNDAGYYFAERQAPAQWGDKTKRQFMAVNGKSYGDHFTDAARAMGETYVEISRGWIHIR
jgi:hypothetical protein